MSDDDTRQSAPPKIVLAVNRDEALKRVLHVATIAFYNALTIVDVEVEEFMRAGKLESDEDLSETIHAAFMGAIEKMTQEEEEKGPKA